MYVRNTLNSYVNTTIKTDRNTEPLWIDIIIGGKKFVVGIIYRPPDLDEAASASLMQSLQGHIGIIMCALWGTLIIRE